MQPCDKLCSVQAGEGSSTWPLSQTRYTTTSMARNQCLPVHRHMWADFRPTSETGHRYLIVFVYRSSGYTHKYFLEKKSDAPDVLNEFLDDIKQSGHRPEHITIKSDAESVYIYGLFQ